MAFGLSGTYNATAEIAAAANRPLIRVMSMAYSAQNVSQYQLVWEYAQTQSWVPGTPDNVRYFSAVCYLTAANAYDALGGAVPMGLIDTSVGGTAIQLWFPPEHWNDCAAVMQPFDVFSPPWTPSCWCGTFSRRLPPTTAPLTDLPRHFLNDTRLLGTTAW